MLRSTLIEYVERMLRARDVGPAYGDLLRTRARKLSEWAGGTLLVSELSCDLVNAWLTELLSSKLNRHTVDGYRRNILAIWNAAYLDAFNDNPPLRVKKIKKPPLSVDAFTREEIRALLGQAKLLRGHYPNAVRRADFWIAAIHAGYSTGLRRGDLLRITKTEIAVDGMASVIQHKTGYRVTVQFSRAATSAINRMPGLRALPWPHHPNIFCRDFARLVKSAKVRPGTFKWLRRSAGSYAEQHRAGDGTRILGHRCERVFRSHYEDPAITRPAPVTPPPL